MPQYDAPGFYSPLETPHKGIQSLDSVLKPFIERPALRQAQPWLIAFSKLLPGHSKQPAIYDIAASTRHFSLLIASLPHDLSTRPEAWGMIMSALMTPLTVRRGDAQHTCYAIHFIAADRGRLTLLIKTLTAFFHESLNTKRHELMSLFLIADSYGEMPIHSVMQHKTTFSAYISLLHRTVKKPTSKGTHSEIAQGIARLSSAICVPPCDTHIEPAIHTLAKKPEVFLLLFNGEYTGQYLTCAPRVFLPYLTHANLGGTTVLGHLSYDINAMVFVIDKFKAFADMSEAEKTWGLLIDALLIPNQKGVTPLSILTTSQYLYEYLYEKLPPNLKLRLLESVVGPNNNDELRCTPPLRFISMEAPSTERDEMLDLLHKHAIGEGKHRLSQASIARLKAMLPEDYHFEYSRSPAPIEDDAAANRPPLG